MGGGGNKHVNKETNWRKTPILCVGHPGTKVHFSGELRGLADECASNADSVQASASLVWLAEHCGQNCGRAAPCKSSGIVVAKRQRSRKGVLALAEPEPLSGTRDRIKECAEIVLDHAGGVDTCLRRLNSWKTHRQLRSTNVRACSVLIFSQFMNIRTVSIAIDLVQ